MNYDVTQNRNDFIGGSDISVIMGISPFKTRFELLLEKAGLKENDFEGNEYTEYGNKLEPQIREFINKDLKNKFEPNRVIKDDIRCHTDGFNGSCVLEIKTTSQIHADIDGYKIYLVQLLLYMQINNVKKGKLAVYERPVDFNTEFDEKRLQIFDIKLSEYKSLLEDINGYIERFRADLEKVKANPLITEEELQPKEVVALSDKIVALENKLKELKAIEEESKNLKTQLYEAMTKYNIKKWVTNNGIQITRVLPTADKTKVVEVFNEDKFKTDYSELYSQYIEKTTQNTKGKKGYVKITL